MKKESERDRGEKGGERDRGDHRKMMRCATTGGAATMRKRAVNRADPFETNVSEKCVHIRTPTHTHVHTYTHTSHIHHTYTHIHT